MVCQGEGGGGVEHTLKETLVHHLPHLHFIFFFSLLSFPHPLPLPQPPHFCLVDLMTITKAGGALGIPGLYVTEDPGAVDDAAKFGNLSLRLGLG